MIGDLQPSCDNCGSHRADCGCHFCEVCGELISQPECVFCEERADMESQDA